MIFQHACLSISGYCTFHHVVHLINSFGKNKPNISVHLRCTVNKMWIGCLDGWWQRIPSRSLNAKSVGCLAFINCCISFISELATIIEGHCLANVSTAVESARCAMKQKTAKESCYWFLFLLYDYLYFLISIHSLQQKYNELCKRDKQTWNSASSFIQSYICKLLTLKQMKNYKSKRMPWISYAIYEWVLRAERTAAHCLLPIWSTFVITYIRLHTYLEYVMRFVLSLSLSVTQAYRDTTAIVIYVG